LTEALEDEREEETEILAVLEDGAEVLDRALETADDTTDEETEIIVALEDEGEMLIDETEALKEEEGEDVIMATT